MAYTKYCQSTWGGFQEVGRLSYICEYAFNFERGWLKGNTVERQGVAYTSEYGMCTYMYMYMYIYIVNIVNKRRPVKASIYTIDILAFTGGACPGDYGTVLPFIYHFPDQCKQIYVVH